MSQDSRKAVFLGLIAVIAIWTLQFLTVRYNYGGNWTGLFCIRDTMPVPQFLQSERIYVFHGIEGYDGQVFHLIAHDPWMKKGSAQAIARPAFRYQRIFVPALAWLLALGGDRRVDAAYIGILLGFVFLGVYWMTLAAIRAGIAAAWGLLFAVAPATIISMDRMTVDVALSALVAGFAAYCEKRPGWRVLILLICAALTRETALPLIAGYAFYLLARRQIASAALAAATALPAAAWFIYLNTRISEHSYLLTFVDWIPMWGWIDRLIHPHFYPVAAWKNLLGQAFDIVALAGIALTLALAAQLARRRVWTARAAAAYALALAVIFLGNRSVWEDVYAFGRVLTPFLLSVVLAIWAQKPTRPATLALAAAPVALVDARVVLNLAAQAERIVRGIIGP